VAAEYRASFTGAEGVLFLGKAQEKATAYEGSTQETHHNRRRRKPAACSPAWRRSTNVDSEDVVIARIRKVENDFT
jgi:hypothetical protein